MPLPPQTRKIDRLTRIVGAGIAAVGFAIAIAWAVVVVSLLTDGQALGVEARGWISIGRGSPWGLLILGPFIAFFVARFGLRAARRDDRS